MTASMDSAEPARAEVHHRAAWRRDLVTALIGVWLVGAVFSDGWAHFNVPELESFVTPWHLALYTGLLAMAGWVGSLAWRGRQRGSSVLDWLPYGYRGTALGLVVFGAGGLADFAWHEVFGIEVAVDALVSPSHLMLGVGGVLILASGLRAQRTLSGGGSGEQPGWTLPAVLSLVLTTALVAFFLLFTSPFPMLAPVESFVPTPEGTPGHEEAELPVIAALSGYLTVTVLITVPFLLMLRSRAGLPRGGLTLLVTAIAGLSVAVVDFPAVAVSGALGATLGAALVDIGLAVLRIRRADRSTTLTLVAASAVLVVWSGQLAGLAIADAIRWPASLAVGVVVLAAFAAAMLGVLASSPTEKPAR